MRKPISLVLPDSDPDDQAEFEADPDRKMILVRPEGAEPGKEIPGFFVLQIDGEWIMSGQDHPGAPHPLPRQFLSLEAVLAYLRETYGWKAPLPVKQYARIEPGGPKVFPVIWGAERKLGRRKVPIRCRYLGSFRWWSGRVVDPTTIGTAGELSSARHVH